MRVEAVSFSGGIWLLWKDNLEVDVIATNSQIVLMKANQTAHDIGLISFIYGSPTYNLQKKLWEGLTRKKLKINGLQISMGDYKVILNIDEVSNVNNFGHHRCAGMMDWVFKERLIYMGYAGSKFT